MKAVAFPKSEKRKVPAAPKTEEEKAAEKQRREEAIKARGNNGARHKEHFEMETVEKDVYPGDVDKDLCIEVGVRYATRYSMIPPKFVKTIYKMHALKKDDVIYSGKAPVTPLLNSCYDGSFVAGIAELRYLYAMPVERIVKYFRSHGFDLDKGTAHGLLAKTSDLVDKLYEAIASYGDVAWDNNLIERTNRHVSASRHSSLFFGSHEGAKRGCKYFSLACTCQNLGINFFDYFSDILGECAEMPNGAPPEAYRNLLPDRWTKE